MAKVAVWAKIPCKPGERDALAAGLQGAIDATADEPGTLLYLLHVDPNDADVLWMYELYESDEALKTHQDGDAFKALGGLIGPHLAGRPELSFITPVTGKGL